MKIIDYGLLIFIRFWHQNRIYLQEFWSFLIISRTPEWGFTFELLARWIWNYPIDLPFRIINIKSPKESQRRIFKTLKGFKFK